MATAMAARAPAAACPGSAARPMLDCAAQSYAAARRSNPHPALAAGQAQALICAANLSDNTHSVVLAREALRGGFAESRILELHADRMARRDFVTRGRSVTHLKDLDNALEAASQLSLNDCSYTALTADLFRGLLATAGDLDHSGLLVEIERRNGLTRES